jgi:hypothetical protein
MKKPVLIMAAAAALALLGASTLDCLAVEKEKPETIKDVMKLAHKGEHSLSKKVSQGKASDAEIKQLLGYYKLMATQKPPRGTEESWKEKTSALVHSTEALSRHEAGAIDQFKEAVNCKACHSVHKPEKK